MSVCPKCETELEEDFGIATCKGCGTVCFVDLDGSVQVQDDSEADDAEGADEESYIVDGAQYETVEDAPEDEEGALDESEDDGGKQDFEETYAEEDYAGEDYVDEDDADKQDFENDDEGFEEEEALEQEEDFLVEEEEAVEVESEEKSEVVSEPMSAASFFEGLEVFAQDASTKDYDHIYYDLYVNGLETAADKSLLAETLADVRLELSEDFILESIDENGSLFLPQISMLRLVVINQRLLSLPFSIDWRKSEEQTAAVYSSGEEESEEGSYNDYDSEYESEEVGEYEEDYEEEV